MKLYRHFLIFICSTLGIFLSAQSPVGVWENYHPEKGTPLSHIQFFEDDGSLHAKVTRIIDEDIEPVCENCKGQRKDQDLTGMVVIWNLKPCHGSKWKRGKILDPESGKVYKCYVQLLSDDRLKVRGYLGFKALGKTQYWSRVTDTQDAPLSKNKILANKNSVVSSNL